VLVATGHYRNGILLAPWTARQVARLALVRGEEEIPEFSPRRFLSAGA
jgi:glycine oxidase